MLDGIQFVTDAKGRRIAVILDLKIHGALWEDFHDSLLVQQRRREPRETLKVVEERLRKRGKLGA